MLDCHFQRSKLSKNIRTLVHLLEKIPVWNIYMPMSNAKFSKFSAVHIYEDGDLRFSHKWGVARFFAVRFL